MKKNIFLSHQITIFNNQYFWKEILFLHLKYKATDIQKCISLTFYVNKIKTPKSSNTEQSENMVM